MHSQVHGAESHQEFASALRMLRFSHEPEWLMQMGYDPWSSRNITCDVALYTIKFVLINPGFIRFLDLLELDLLESGFIRRGFIRIWIY